MNKLKLYIPTAIILFLIMVSCVGCTCPEENVPMLPEILLPTWHQRIHSLLFRNNIYNFDLIIFTVEFVYFYRSRKFKSLQ